MILYLSQFIFINFGKCPSPKLLYPCICGLDNINCSGNETLDLKLIFQNMSLNLNDSDKHFDSFFLGNTAIMELEDNTFHDITFKTIVINQTKSLKRIASNAFSSYNTFTLESVYLNGYSQLGEQYVNELFTALSSLINLKNIWIMSSIISIPSHAFSLINGLQKNLSVLEFIRCRNCDYQLTIKSIGNFAFYYLGGLERIDLRSLEINHISAHAFDFWDSSENVLSIDLTGNKLNDTTIEIGTFTNAKRPLEIKLDNNQFTYLDEKIFSNILQIDERNKIYVVGNKLECDCRMLWIIRKKEFYENKIFNITCQNVPNFWQLSERDFNNCEN